MKPFSLLLKSFIIIFLSCGILMSSCTDSKETNSAKVYVANEGGGSVSIIDLRNNFKTTNIDISDSSGQMYMAHNVQAAPDGKSIWVAATSMDSSGISSLIVIDPGTNAIRKRVQLGKKLHLAHVVLDNESRYAFTTANEGNEVIQVDASSYQVVRKFELGANHGPHGMRYSQGKLYVANMDAKSMSVINVDNRNVTEIPLGGIAVQVAVTKDNEYVFISLYDRKEVVRYGIKDGKMLRIALPAVAQGPIQLYATPDSKLVYVADQGELLGRPVSNKVFVIDVPNGKVINTIQVGSKAHGVVISKDGKSVFVTNTADNTVSVIDVGSQKVIHSVPVGKGPNGISYWFETGGMP